MATKTKINYGQLLDEILDTVGAEVSPADRPAAVEYVSRWWEPSLATGKKEAKALGLTAREYALNSVGNGIVDGDYREADDFDASEGEQKEQEIIEVSQGDLKKALKALMTEADGKQSPRVKMLNLLYEKHAEYNEEYFFGELSYPLITIEKLDNRTLGNYTHGQDEMGINNHIRLNVNFVALNTEERILETLRHEMIHQWQDEVLYYKTGKPKSIWLYAIDDKGERIKVNIDQKKFPADHHNKDFKEMAKVVGIPAEGDKCYGNPANMPQAQSYNRKYQCKCIASNGYPVSVWSTRPITAKCLVCGAVYKEKVKGGSVVEVKKSDVEKPGQDAVQERMAASFKHFSKVKSKKALDLLMQNVEAQADNFEHGVYEKNHNAYKEGFTHWVAYNAGEVITPASEPPKTRPQAKTKGKKNAKPLPKKHVAKKSSPADTKKEEPKAADEPKTLKLAGGTLELVKLPKEEPKPVPKKPKAPKKKAEPKPEPTPELPKEEPASPKKGQDDVKKPELKLVKGNPGERSHTNPQDLLDLYAQFGSLKKVAEYFGMTSANIAYWAKKTGADFKSGRIVQ